MATPHTIAVAGKGGVGKTTTCGMIVDYLCKKKQGPILVVDADANSNLNEVLGVEESVSLGTIREEMAQAELKGTIPAGMTKALGGVEKGEAKHMLVPTETASSSG